ncbi:MULTISPECIES: alkaline phosphatase D family protein [Halorussus]|uniref:alkaline phosphatase D family protein n=1 Tax=Halorussus TaxID=1070314 RepID=UPI0020A1C94E|nr:alkaline phosphatase D family protein [Halorussus vallis]USZ74482.1 alkaline phosphatase D family protein [Halorussus vallis]
MPDSNLPERHTPNRGGDADSPEVAVRSPVRSADAFDPDPTGDTDRVFPLSVASGSPTPTGVVLWTRVAPEAYDSETPLGLTVAEDPDFESVVSRSRIPAAAFGRRHDYTVRVDLSGELDPDRHYYYRFVHDGVASNVGRCRTLPAPDASPDSVSLGVVGCQHYQNGYYGAYNHLAGEDVDFVLHLGDYVYEATKDQFRAPGATDYPGRDFEFPSGHDVAWNLADFRKLYRTYRSDGFLQAAHERHTFIRAWDDHAVANNRYWDYEADAPATADHPRGDDPAFMRRLTADGIRAWWEYTPARVDYDPDADHLHDALRLWRRFEFGDLLTLLLTDERLFRSEPPCADDTLLPDWLPWAPSLGESGRTMLGERQREWFLDGVRSSDATWTGWANEVLSMPFRVGVGPVSTTPNLDAWDGYDRERDLVFDALAEAENAVTLTGDMHTAIAGYQRTDDGAPVGVEFMTPSVTSVNIAESVSAHDGLAAKLTRPLLSNAVTAMNPHFEFFDSHHWGYSVAEFTRDDCTFTTYSVDKSVDSPNAERERLAKFRVPAGRVEIQREA